MSENARKGDCRAPLATIGELESATRLDRKAIRKMAKAGLIAYTRIGPQTFLFPRDDALAVLGACGITLEEANANLAEVEHRKVEVAAKSSKRPSESTEEVPNA